MINDKGDRMKFISWNVNGFRAVLQKGFEEYFRQADADFFCLQETKMQEGQADFKPEGYFSYYHSAQKRATLAQPSLPNISRWRCFRA